MKEQIKQALENATPNWHDNGNEIVSLDNQRVGIGGFLKEEDNHLAANAPEWLRWQNERIEQLEQDLMNVMTLVALKDSILAEAIARTIKAGKEE